MTSPNPCPPWCSDKRPADDPAHFHLSAQVLVRAGRSKPGVNPLALPVISVRAVLSEYPTPRRPFLAVHALDSEAGSVWVRPLDGGSLAAVVDALAAATPAQHRELAAAIRQAAAFLNEEVA